MPLGRTGRDGRGASVTGPEPRRLLSSRIDRRRRRLTLALVQSGRADALRADACKSSTGGVCPAGKQTLALAPKRHRSWILRRTMSEEESTTPDLVRLARQGYAAMSRGDLDAVMSLFAADAVYDASAAGLGTFEGAEAVRGSSRTGVGAGRTTGTRRRSSSISGTASCLASFGRAAAWSAAKVASSSGPRTSSHGRTARSSGSSTTPT